MANLEISNLPPITVPLSADALAIVNDGVTKQITRAQMFTLALGENLVLPNGDDPTDPEIQFPNSGVYEDLNDELAFTQGGVKVGHLTTPAAGGLFVDNQASGGGLERVLTTSDFATFGEYGGEFDASGGTFPAGATAQDWYNCTVDGTIDGQAFVVGDILIALIDAPSTVTFAANWSLVPHIGVADHTLLTNIGTNTHAQIDAHIAATAANVSAFDVYNFNFSTATNTGVDPGTGNFIYSNGSYVSIASCAISDTDADGNDVSALMNAMPVGAYLRFFDPADPTVDHMWGVTSVTDFAGWTRYFIEPMDNVSTTIPANATALQIMVRREAGIDVGALGGGTGNLLYWQNGFWNSTTAIIVTNSSGSASPRIRTSSTATTNHLAASISHDAGSVSYAGMWFIDGATAGQGFYGGMQSNLGAGADVFKWGYQSATPDDIIEMTETLDFRVTPAGTFRIGEKAAAGADVTAYGQLWVNSSDDSLNYQTEAGVNFDLTAGGSATPLDVIGDINTAAIPVAEAYTAALRFMDNAEAVVVGSIGYNATSPFDRLNIQNRYSSGIIDFYCQESYVAAGAPSHTFPTNQIITTHTTTAAPSSGNQVGHRFRWQNRSGLDYFMIHGNQVNENIEFDNYVDGSKFDFFGEDGVRRFLLELDPSGSSYLHYAPDSHQVMRSVARTSGGMELYNTATGSTWERVLTESDGAGGAGTTTWSTGGGSVFATGATQSFAAGAIMEFEEQASLAAPAATFGRLWLRNDTPNVLIFTDDAGTDHDLTAGGISAPIQLADSEEIQFGTGNDVQMAFDGTDMNMTAALTGGNFNIVDTTNVRIGDASNTGTSLLVLRNDSGAARFMLDNSTGDARISQLSSALAIEDEWISFARNGAVGLRHNNTLKLATSADGVTISGDIAMGDGNITGPVLVDYAIESDDAVVAANAVTLTYSTANVHALDLEAATGTVAITISGGPPAGTYGEMTVKVQQDTTADRVLTWAGGTFIWAVDGIIVDPKTGSDAITMYHLQTWDGGTTWYISGVPYGV